MRVIEIGEPQDPAGISAYLGPLARPVATGLVTPDLVNDGRARRHSFGAMVHEAGLTHAIAMFEVAPRHLPLPIDRLEKHPMSEQLILPVAGIADWVVVVAPDAAGGPDLEQARAVRLRSGQGIIYGVNVWHLAICHDSPGAGLFLVQSMKAGTVADCLEQPVDSVVLVNRCG